MKVQERLDQQAWKKPSDLQKMKIYQQFLDKSHRSISYHKVSYYAKVAVFSLGLFLLGWTVYYSATPTNSPYQIVQTNESFISLEARPGQYVQADTIGQIISTAWAIQITHDNAEIETQTLHANNKVLLADGAEMHFRLDEYIHAKITGPAEFILEDAGRQDGIKKYVINLISWDYLEILTVKNKVDLLEEVTTEPTAQISVKAADFTIEQVDTRGNVDLVISTNADGKKQVANKGTEVVIKKIVAQKQTYIAIQQDETVSVNEYVEFIRDDVSPEEVLAKIEDAKFAVRYELDEVEGKSTSLSASEVLKTSTTLTKKVATDELMSFVTNSLSVSSLQRYVSQMEEHYIAWEIDAFGIAYTNLIHKVTRWYALAWFSYTGPATTIDMLPSTATALTSLASKLDTTRYIHPSDLQWLRVSSLALQALFVKLSAITPTQDIVDIEEEIIENNSEPSMSDEQTISIENTKEMDVEIDEEDTLESLLQWVIDPTIPLQ